MNVEIWKEAIKEPELTFTVSADAKLKAMLKHHKNEVMFLLLIKERKPHVLEVYDILYPKNTTMDGAFCKIDHDDHSNSFYNRFVQLYGSDRTLEIWRDQIGIAHSHVNMGASFSGYDNTFIDDYLKQYRSNYFVFSVFNKSMQHTIHLYDSEQRAKFLMPYIVQPSEKEIAACMSRIARESSMILQDIAGGSGDLKSGYQRFVNLIQSPVDEKVLSRIDKSIEYLATRRMNDLDNTKNGHLARFQSAYDGYGYNGCQNNSEYTHGGLSRNIERDMFDEVIYGSKQPVNTKKSKPSSSTAVVSDEFAEIDVDSNMILDSLDYIMGVNYPELVHVWFNYGAPGAQVIPRIFKNMPIDNVKAMVIQRLIDMSFYDVGDSVFDIASLKSIYDSTNEFSANLVANNPNAYVSCVVDGEAHTAAKSIIMKLVGTGMYEEALDAFMQESYLEMFADYVDDCSTDGGLDNSDLNFIGTMFKMYVKGLILWVITSAIFDGHNPKEFNKSVNKVIRDSNIADKSNIVDLVYDNSRSDDPQYGAAYFDGLLNEKLTALDKTGFSIH